VIILEKLKKDFNTGVGIIDKEAKENR